ncbi:MAG TPA: hypothetical protein VEM32_11395 [Geobacteraceae bacterium]|nr:hypothetical protein [Geobacteraceae bacterium]
MSELRQNMLNGNWSLIVPERREKPKFLDGQLAAGPSLLEHDAACPFCPNNEEQFPLEIISETKDGQGNWTSRIISNKYKLFADFHTCAVSGPFKQHGIYTYCDGCGNHLVIVEGRYHNKQLGEMGIMEVGNTLRSHRDACLLMKANPNNRITFMYKNQGVRAGASQFHAHSQIVGSCAVPNWIRNAMHVQDKYFDDHGVCALCNMINYETSARERIVFETSSILVLSPYAASSPYETWIVPKRHFCCFEEISEVEIVELALAYKKVLGAYIMKLGNPDFNFFIHTAPHLLAAAPSLHLYLQIRPRLAVPGGFETGTNIPVNPVWPENVPQHLAID